MATTIIELSEYTRDRWNVIRCEQRKRGGTRRKFLGTVERHCFRNERGQETGFWVGRGNEGSGWHAPVRSRFDTKDEAVAYVVKETGVPYQDRQMEWAKR